MIRLIASAPLLIGSEVASAVAEPLPERAVIRFIAALIVRLRLGHPRPCGDADCVAESPEEHGLSSHHH